MSYQSGSDHRGERRVLSRGRPHTGEPCTANRCRLATIPRSARTAHAPRLHGLPDREAIHDGCQDQELSIRVPFLNPFVRRDVLLGDVHLEQVRSSCAVVRIQRDGRQPDPLMESVGQVVAAASLNPPRRGTWESRIIACLGPPGGAHGDDRETFKHGRQGGVSSCYGTNIFPRRQAPRRKPGHGSQVTPPRAPRDPAPPSWPERGIFRRRVAGWKGLRRAVSARPTGAPHGKGARTRLDEVLTAHRSVERPANQR